MKTVCIVTILYILSFQLFGQEIPNGFYSYKLENGLELYVQEDFTIPSMQIEYISKAGTGRQTKENTGFFQLYTRLFWKNSVSSSEDYNTVGAGEFSAQTGFSQSKYGFVVPASQFENGIKVFSQELKNTQFTDKDIKTEFEQLKQEVVAWASSVPGFINASVDARVFSKQPWTKDSGIYPALFSSNTTEDIRQKLSSITQKWYVPDQSALFITGPISAESVLSIVSDNFNDWKSSFVIGNASDASKSLSAININNDKKTFVLVSSDFSKDYIQAVLQYTAPGLGASNEYSASAWTAAEIMQSKLIEAGMTNTNTEFIADASDSRIIIQTLFDAQSLGPDTDISLMVPGFSNIVKTTAKTLTESDLIAAKDRAKLLRNDAYSGTDNFIEAVAANWAYGGIEYFFNWPEAVQAVPLKDVKTTFDDPWIFVLLHTDLYTKNKMRFDTLGFTEITRDSGAWYAMQEDSENHNNEIITPETAIFEYTSFTKALINEFSVSSGISVTTQDIPSTPWVSFLLTIKGGEVLNGQLKRGTEKIAVNNLNNTINKELSHLYYEGIIQTVPVVESDTDIYSSYVSIVCLRDDLYNVLEVVSNTIKKSSISVATADELFISSAYNWRIESGGLEYQLYAAAMETLYGGSKAEGLFNANTELMLQADYNDIKIATELIYDPMRLSVVLTGSIPHSIKEDIEKTFGRANFYPHEKQFRATIVDEQKPIFSPFEQIVRLRHTFLTDVPANLAGDRPTKLIPTTDFSDPAQLYFEVPSFNDSEQALFISLLYEITDRLSREFSTLQNSPAQAVSVVPGTGLYPVSSFRFSKVKSRETLKKLVQNTFDSLNKELQTDNTVLLSKIRSRFARILSREMITLNDRSHLIQQGIRSSNNPMLYLEKFDTVENAKSEDFYNVFNNFIKNGEFFWIFSADTKR